MEKEKKKAESNNMLPKETHFSLKDPHRLTAKEWRKTFQANGNQKKAWVTISEKKRDFKMKMVKGDRKVLIMKMGAIH